MVRIFNVIHSQYWAKNVNSRTWKLSEISLKNLRRQNDIVHLFVYTYPTSHL